MDTTTRFTRPGRGTGRTRTGRSVLTVLVGVAALLTTLAVVPPPAAIADAGGPFVVNTTADVISPGGCGTTPEGTCSLREAVIEANAHAGADTIILAGGATYTLTIPGAGENAAATGDLDLTGVVTICTGAGGVCTKTSSVATVDASGLTPTGQTYGDRAFDVQPGATVTMRNFTIENGNGDANTSGGGILDQAQLTLDSMTLHNNKTAASGGGVFYPTGAAPTSTITSSVFVANTAQKGGAIRANNSVAIDWSSITSNTATAVGDGFGIFTGATGATVSLAHSILQNPNGTSSGYDCASAGGSFTSGGYNLTLSPASTCNATATTDIPSTSTTLYYGIVPIAPSAAIDEGGTGCPTTDVLGDARPAGLACDIGAYEGAVVPSNEVLAHYATSTIDTTSGTSTVTTAASRAYARYAVGNDLGGDADIATIAASHVLDGIPVPTATTNWGAIYQQIPNEFDLATLMRLVDLTPPSGWSSTAHSSATGWATKLATLCSYDSPSDSDTVPDFYTYMFGNGPFTLASSENHMLEESVECLLSLHATGNSAWQVWETGLAAWVRADAKAGLLGEIASPGYGKYSLAPIIDMADFTPNTDLHDVTRRWLDVFWQDAAMNYDAQTAVVGASGSRMYEPDPDVNGEPSGAADYYANPQQNWSHQWAYLYGWSSAVDVASPQLLPAATSTYAPLAMSKQVALLTGKSESYTSARPGAVGGAESVAREITVNDAYMLGAQTYSIGSVTWNAAMTQNIWYAVTVNNGAEPRDRLVISGVGEIESASTPNYTSTNAINGAAYGNVIIAARNKLASNSRGVRVYLGSGALRTNLTANGGWWFTSAGNALVAVRFAGPTTQLSATKELREIDPAATDTNGVCSGTKGTCCPAPANGSSADCWAPLVVQTAQVGTGSGQYTSLSAFETAVLATSWTYSGGTLTYVSPAGDKYTMSRQQTTASLPSVVPHGTTTNVITTAPTSTYAATPSYLSMTYGNPTATLCPPSGTCVTRSFS